jgi:uncharacterized integral membrane protein
MSYMRYFYTLLSIILFFAALGLTARNLEPVTLHYYLGLAWSAPLALMLFASFLAGVACTVIAGLSMYVKYRRELAALKRELSRLNPQENLPVTDLSKTSGIS